MFIRVMHDEEEEEEEGRGQPSFVVVVQQTE